MNIMIDVETLSTRPNAVIIAIGAAKFEIRGEISETFYVNCDVMSSKNAGLHIEKVTVDWWKNQNLAAFKKTQENPIHIKDALTQLIEWCGPKAKGTMFWAQGTSFDPPILESSMRAVGLEPPWRYWNWRDTRTVYDVAGIKPKSIERIGQYHNALDDILTQIKLLNMSFEAL